MLLEVVNGLCEAEWHFVQQMVFCCERITCAKVQLQLLLLIKAAYGTYGALGNMETKLQYRFLNPCAVLIKLLVFETSLGC